MSFSFGDKNSSGLFGSQSTSTLFGNSSSNSSTAPASSAFGSSGNKDSNVTAAPAFSFDTPSQDKKKGGTFGTSNTETNKSSNPFSFGNTSSNTTSNTTSSSLFGNNTSGSTGGLFGSSEPKKDSSSSSLFGSSEPKKDSSSASLFGSKPAETKTSDSGLKTSSSLFGSSNTPSSGLFGNSSAGNDSNKKPSPPFNFSSNENKSSSTLFGSNENKPEAHSAKKTVTFDTNKNTEKVFEKNDAEKAKSGGTVNAAEAVANLDLNGLSVESIIASWHEKLQLHVEMYASAATKVRERDLILYQNEQKITELAKQAHILKSEQDELQWNLDTVSELQHDLHLSLDQLEGELESLESSQPKVFNVEAAEERRRGYENISKINSRLMSMKSEINEKMGDLTRDPREEEKSGDKTDAKQVMGIMKQQHLTIEFLSQATSKLERELLRLQNA